MIGNSLLDQQVNFYRRSQIEQKALNSVEHVIGRTDIDRMVSLTANPHLHYHFCNEILRDEFYTGEKWDPEQIEEYSIMVRSTGNPLKGLHMMLKAMPPILERFPKAVLHVVGNNIFYPTTAKARFVEGSYNKLCRKLLEKYRLKDHIAFLGNLNATEMRKQYLRANVVVSASIIENESNVVSEAKILGVPVVSSYVGGLPNRITHGIDGFLYPFNLPEMLAYYVKEIFTDADLARSISKNAIRTQAHTNDPDRNSSRLFEIYKSMIK